MNKLRNLFKKATTWCVILAIVVISASAAVIGGINSKKTTYKSAYERIMAEDGFIYGVTVPWWKYSKSAFGSYVKADGTTVLPTYDEATFRDIILNCKSIGLNSINFWLFTYYAGIKTDSVGNIEGFDEYFMDNLLAVMELCKENDMSIALTTYVHTMETISYRETEDWGELTFQPLVNPDVRKQFMDKILDPLCEAIKDYEDIITLFNVYSEPEGQVDGRNGAAFATDWENNFIFIKDSVAVMKKHFPNIPVTVAGGWGSELSNYNELGLDLNGTDIYEATGKVYDPDDENSDMPVICMEFGHDAGSGGDTVSDEVKINHMSKSMNNFKAHGYVGEYYYAYNGGTGGGLSFLNNDTMPNSLCNMIPAMRYIIEDQKAEFRGVDLSEVTAPDKPGLIGMENSLSISWIASRRADKYKLEVSKDNKKWEVVDDNILPEDIDADGNNICDYTFKTPQAGGECYYRVTAYNSDGESAVSDSRWYNIPELFCDEEDNLIKNHSFETGDFTNWTNNAPDAFKLVKGEAAEGEYYIDVDGKITWNPLYQTVNVERNTDYVLTFWAKSPSSYDRQQPPTVYKLIDTAIWSNFTGDLYFKNFGDDWKIYNMTFNSGERDQVTVYFADGNSQDLCIDSVYLFKKSN